jgi:hypothetical protein
MQEKEPKNNTPSVAAATRLSSLARSRQIDVSVDRWYHCVTRCVRRAFLLGDGTSDSKGWIEKRIEELSESFAVDVGGFSVLRLFRAGKAAISANLNGIFERLGSRAENWQVRMEKLRKGRLFGRFFAASREKLLEKANQVLHRLPDHASDRHPGHRAKQDDLFSREDVHANSSSIRGCNGPSSATSD